RMSGWNFLLIWLPVVGAIVSIVWCFKICVARQKSGGLGLFFLLPITNILMFLYLAFSKGVDSQERVVKLQFTDSPRLPRNQTRGFPPPPANATKCPSCQLPRTARWYRVTRRRFMEWVS